MTRSLITIVACLFLLGNPTISARSATQLLESVRNIQHQPNGSTHCTASLINKRLGYWLTAAHCTEDVLALYINNSPATLVAKTQVYLEGDMAILSSTTTTSRALHLAKQAPKTGDYIRMAGYPVGVGPILTTGFVANPYILLTHYGESLAVFDMDVCGGNSGSAVVNADDDVISVMTRYYYPTDYPCTGLSAGTPYSQLKAFAGPYFEA